MNYYVIMRSLLDISENIIHQLDNWKKELTEVLSAIEAYKTVSSIQGAAGEALNDYLDSVHSTIISTIGSEFSDYSAKITPYVNDYISLEESEEGIIWSETIQNQIDMIPKEKTVIDDIALRVTDVISSVSDIVSPSVNPDIAPIDMTYDEMTMFLTELDEAIEEIESNHAGDMENIRSLIITLKGIIEPNKTLILEDVSVQRVGEFVRESFKDLITHGIYNGAVVIDNSMYFGMAEYGDEINRHYIHNSKVGWKQYLDKVKAKYRIDSDGSVHVDTSGEGFYIEHQSMMEGMLYGIDFGKEWNNAIYGVDELFASSNACEVIATYNAMAYLEGGYSPVEFPDMLKSYEGKGTALLGNWGASPSAVEHYLKGRGYSTKLVSGADLGESGKGYLSLQDEYDVYIMSVWNEEGKISSGIHTMAITKEKNGSYVVHNSITQRKNGVLNEYETLRSAVLSFDSGTGDPISLIGVRKK